jgi:hypothetical protein
MVHSHIKELVINLKTANALGLPVSTTSAALTRFVPR